MMVKMVIKAVFLLVFLSVNASSGEKVNWLTDMDEAQKVAMAENKGIMVFFTGSDWCVWCIRLDEEVLSQEAFSAYAKDHLVFVELDFPNDETLLAEEQLAHNQKWQEEFGVSAFPSLYLADASAKPYARTGYRKGGPAKYVEHLKLLMTMKQKVADLQGKAAKATGLNRARFLDGLFTLENAIVGDRAAMAAEILSLVEKADSRGRLYDKYRGIEEGNEAAEALGAIIQESFQEGGPPDPDALLSTFEKYQFIKDVNVLGRFVPTLINSFIASQKASEGISYFHKKSEDSSYPVESRQLFLFAKAQLMIENGDKQAAKDIVETALDLAPASKVAQQGDEILVFIDSFSDKL